MTCVFSLEYSSGHDNTVHGKFIADYEAARKRLEGRGIKFVTESRIIREMRAAEERSGECVACGQPVAAHFDLRNRKLACPKVSR